MINKAVAGQSEFTLITLDAKGNARVIGTEHVDSRYTYVNPEASNYVEVPEEMLAKTKDVISYWASIGGFEGGDAEAVKTELEKEITALTPVDVVEK